MGEKISEGFFHESRSGNLYIERVRIRVFICGSWRWTMVQDAVDTFPEQDGIVFLVK